MRSPLKNFIIEYGLIICLVIIGATFLPEIGAWVGDQFASVKDALNFAAGRNR